VAVIVAALPGSVWGATTTVDECVRLALARAPSEQAALADVAAANAHVRAARAAYWPRLLAQSQYGQSYGYDVAVTNGGVTQLGVGIEAPLLDGGRRTAELDAARARLRSATAIEQQRRADVAFAVRGAYFAALAQRDDGAAHTETVRTLTDYLALLERLSGLGLVPRSDVPRAELALESERSAERASAAALEADMEELSELTGITLEASALTDPEPLLFATAPQEVIESTPAIADARAAAEAAQHDADAVRSEGRPHLALNADGGFLGVNFAPTFRNNGGGEFLFGFSLPLFDGGAIAARTAAAEAVRASAEANVAQVRQTIAIALAHARTDAQRAQADAAAWQDKLPAAAEAFLLMRARYAGGGSVRLLDVLDALNQSVGARLALAGARLDYRVAVATQDHILGRVPQ
jgi:adhesin transport system outer membrane protein